MNLFPADEPHIKTAAVILKNGGIVSFPTETVYGLGADAFNAMAVAKVFEAKRRPSFDPLIVHISEIVTLDRLVTSVSDMAYRLIRKFWPGPLTLVFPKRAEVPDIVTAGLSTVAVRMPAHPVALALIRELGGPIAAPSANPFGYLSPTSASHVRDQLGDRIDMILDGGQCDIGVESTIIMLNKAGAFLLRPGGLTIEDIEGITGKLEIKTEDTGAGPEAPGQLSSHYSPHTPIRVVKDINKIRPGIRKTGLLAFRSYPERGGFSQIEILSEAGDIREAAARLFVCLHSLDRAGLDIIYAEQVPETGLGRAIMNRLYKAEGKG